MFIFKFIVKNARCLPMSLDSHSKCYMEKRCLKYETCPMTLFHRLVSGKWKILILWYLSGGNLRFSEIKRKLPK